MSAALPICSGAQAARAFVRAGWVHDRPKGSHLMLKKTGSSVVLSVPQHRELVKGILRSLISDAGLSVADFVKLL
ncbi:MAG TPA: type II toxin-antitoxin system HicA family toxin [Candidatus Binataceae bacterium]|nr:type II toxin-antitoxin system HicA family toxin [Candidatus Binataceae bacterium]